jgi:hypothetical protein
MTYQDWIWQHYPTSDSALAQCVEACAAMRLVFPELKEKNGVVYSFVNRDNIPGGNPKEYPHRWLVTSTGEIIDPTVLQYELLGDLHYREMDVSQGMWRCRGCGDWQTGIDNYFCGCKWSYL